jgi:uncharacterized DUF497 family protein
MGPFTWSHEKNALLLAERGLCFEAVVAAIEAGDLLDVLAHSSPERYPGQRILVVRLNGYAHLVPYVQADDGLFLKTIIPSRKATRRYLPESTS